MADSSVSFVALEQEDVSTANTARKQSKKWKLLVISGFICLLSVVLVCIIVLLTTHYNLFNLNKTNTKIIVNQRAISSSLNSQIMASKYPNHVIHNEFSNTETTKNRRLQSLTLNDEYDYAWVGGVYVSIDGSDTFTSIPVIFDSGSSNFWITSNDFCVDCSTCTNPSYQTVNLCASFSDDGFDAFYPNTNNKVYATLVNDQIETWSTDAANNPPPDVSIEFINGGAWTGTATNTDCSSEDWIFCIQYEHGKTEGIYSQAQFKTNIYAETSADGWISVAYMDTTGVSYHANGVFGLGFSELAVDVDPPLKQMVDAQLVNNNYFSMHFEPDTGSGDAIGYIQFGGETNTDGNFLGVFDVIDGSDYFEIAMDSLSVDEIDISISSTTALLDTGTSFIIGPDADVVLIIQEMRAYKDIDITLNSDYGLYTVDCSAQNDLPNIGIKMLNQDHVLNVTPELYVFSNNNGIDGQCIIGVKSLDEPHDLNNAWILGDVYLKTIGCVQFDVSNRQILFSQTSLGCQVQNTQIQ